MPIVGDARIDVSVSAYRDADGIDGLSIRGLLAHYAVSALGLTLLDEQHPLADHLARRAPIPAPAHWVAWQTNAGQWRACAYYDHAKSKALQLHVLQIEWWLPPDRHHVNWWRCNPRRPHEWTVGRG